MVIRKMRKRKELETSKLMAWEVEYIMAIFTEVFLSVDFDILLKMRRLKMGI